ncbi:helix-turn-helix domain-containing protein [Nocardia cyriacigeorgica]|uniref:helix-turn-helix domain-containing protein n=1 Tax=Nocardia cyriacigeorgica TaxID=135487 RepID=UPI001895D0D2|nr:helix-turn-helix transcriptional regulator [Nocardia cyriacigeorgica]MBF6325891.1 helix-turn-helix transcriptional regulator [Nocardia cyriacigeorgica]
MSRKPARRRTTNTTSRTRQRPSIPTLGSACRQMRDELGLSRASAYTLHGVSPSYLADIEADLVTPRIEMLDSIIAGYQLDPFKARYLRDLHAPPLELAPVAVLRRQVTSNTGLMMQLSELEERDVLAALVDPLWNILACNDLFESTLAGVEATYSITGWLFGPHSQQVLIERDREIGHSIASTKSVLARYRDSQQARDLIRGYQHNQEFCDAWRSNTDIGYGRDSADLMHCLSPATREPISYRVTIAEPGQAPNVQLLMALPRPYSGPPLATIEQ